MPTDRPLLLVVDDEATVLRYVSNALRIRQFGFILAEDGERGLDLFLANRDEIAMVLTDVAMPRLSGPEMARQIRRIDPQVGLIFMTGFSPTQVIPQEFRACPWLSKPFTPQQLFDVIDQCLKSREHKPPPD